MNKPNIILLTIDTLRADMLSCYGYAPPTTPHLDELAAKGVRFTQAITGGSWTQAAFPVLLTSSAAAMYGGCLGGLAPERPSPVAALAAHGYTTAGFSTNPHLSPATGYDRGFHHFSELKPAESDPPLRRIKGGEHLLRQPLTHYLSGWLGKQSRPARLYASAAELTDHICHWLDTVEPPFFGWAHYMDVHWPYYLEEELTHPEKIARAWQDLALMHRWANNKASGVITRKLEERFVGLYVESLEYLDAQIGRLLARLDERGYGSDSIVVAVSDHGEEFFDHGRWGHWENNLHDEIIKVPLIMRLPGLPERQVIDCQVSTLDIMPTLLELCDCPVPDGVEGTSFRALLAGHTGGDAYDVPAVISEMPRDSWHRVAVRTEAFKLIWDNRHPDALELYDLEADPGEKMNVAGDYPEITAHLQTLIDDHLHRVAATKPHEPAKAVEFDAAILARLRDLGYVD